MSAATRNLPEAGAYLAGETMRSADWAAGKHENGRVSRKNRTITGRKVGSQLAGTAPGWRAPAAREYRMSSARAKTKRRKMLLAAPSTIPVRACAVARFTPRTSAWKKRLELQKSPTTATYAEASLGLRHAAERRVDGLAIRLAERDVGVEVVDDRGGHVHRVQEDGTQRNDEEQQREEREERVKRERGGALIAVDVEINQDRLLERLPEMIHRPGQRLPCAQSGCLLVKLHRIAFPGTHLEVEHLDAHRECHGEVDVALRA